MSYEVFRLRVFLIPFFCFCLWLSVTRSQTILNGSPLVLSNDTLHVRIDKNTGEMSVHELISGRRWSSDPWEGAAGLLEVQGPDGKQQWNLSQASEITATDLGDGKARILFRNRKRIGDMPDWTVATEISISRNAAVMEIRIPLLKIPDGYSVERLYYPARQFHLKTDLERGFAVFPFWQGAIIPSYIFPMNGGRFCMWDDRQHSSEAVGELYYYDWQGLTMHWFGIHDDRSAVLVVIPRDGSIRMQYINNYDMSLEYGQKHHRYTPWPRILALSPVWYMPDVNENTVLKYYFQPGGDHVSMAKQYRKIAIAEGIFVSLKDKARKNPDVNKLKGALYTGIYGAYPHYVNLPGMAFTFDELDDMMRDMYENLGLRKAFVHAWGTYENYAPVLWPINEELGGVERLRQVVNRIKEYGWLYSSYHSFVSLLPHDPKVDLDLAPTDSLGNPVIRGRWMNVDPDHWIDLTKELMAKELPAVGPNADVTDIVFGGKVDERGVALAKYLASTGLVLGTERGNEWLIPWYHFLEGMVFSPFNIEIMFRMSHPAPLFNLVYHDAITNFGKIQDPNHLPIGVQGDYYTKTLRQMAYGDGPMVFFSPYEYQGVRPYIRFAAKMLSPLHESIAFEELVNHEYLSPDFQVQSTRFANGVEVFVNLGPTPFSDGAGLELPGYGFRILKADGSVNAGRFHHAVEIDGDDIDY